jgi:hypothetical protein
VLLRESQVQPLLLVCEDLHWIDTERLSGNLPALSCICQAASLR